MSRVAIYARVSTDDSGQDPENQLVQLRAWCSAAGHGIAGEYVDSVSGAKGADERHELALLLDDAHKRKFDLVLCWSLDRLSREGLEPTIGYLRRLSAAGVAFHSYLEPMLSTDNPMVRDVLLAVMASMAAMERARISERTKAGLDRVRAKGQRLGRPVLGGDMRARIADLAATGASAYRISKTLGCDIKTAAKYAA
jgi:DNA invertase Pin-like site-specific DNA recombinase